MCNVDKKYNNYITSLDSNNNYNYNAIYSNINYVYNYIDNTLVNGIVEPHYVSGHMVFNTYTNYINNCCNSMTFYIDTPVKHKKYSSIYNKTKAIYDDNEKLKYSQNNFGFDYCNTAKHPILST